MKLKFQTKVEFIHIAVVRLLERTFSILMKSSEQSSTNIFSETQDMILKKLLGGKEMFIGTRD